MPRLHDVPPEAVQADIESLQQSLKGVIPSKRLDENLLIATWNIRSFASLTRKWTAGDADSPKRDLRGLLAIGEIIRRFDVIAVQEVKGDLRALRDLMKWLGPDWAFLMTDVNIGAAGNSERMAFVFDRRRVELSGLACELVVPEEWLKEVGSDALRRQFARTPYAVSFRSGKQTFILVTLHVDYGDSASERIPELKGIARWMRDWADRTNAWSQNLIAMGDFNIDRKKRPAVAGVHIDGSHSRGGPGERTPIHLCRSGQADDRQVLRSDRLVRDNQRGEPPFAQLSNGRIC